MPPMPVTRFIEPPWGESVDQPVKKAPPWSLSLYTDLARFRYLKTAPLWSHGSPLEPSHPFFGRMTACCSNQDTRIDACLIVAA
jgi:hypothetical protein